MSDWKKYLLAAAPAALLVIALGALQYYMPSKETVVIMPSPEVPVVTPVPVTPPPEVKPNVSVKRAFSKKDGKVQPDEVTTDLAAVINRGIGEYELKSFIPGEDEVVYTVSVRGGKAPRPPPVVVDPVTPIVPAPPGPVIKGTQVTYVFEKDDTAVPSYVYGAFQKLGTRISLAATFEKDTVDGTGETPEQYKVPREAAMKAGLPALVYTKDSAVIKVVKSPKSEEEVLAIAP